ncbi:MAG: chorismate synthase, partial [Gemmatimonadaceae bacterium]|nr:chorismate synthase [Gemmatimonadaceae bacterium]
DYRGGGRSSARETAARVAAGAVARKVIEGVGILGHVVEIGGDRAQRFAAHTLGDNDFWCADPEAVKRWAALLDGVRKAGSSVGAVVEVIASGVPAGWGSPLYAKLDGALAAAMMSINAVKGIEIGDGFAAARLRGEDNADRMRPGAGEGDPPTFDTNHAGGVMGGISTGQDVICRIALKPTSSILTPVQTITRYGEAVEVMTKGRHDPCVGIRAVPVAEAMMACVLADAFLMHRAQCG